MNSPVLFATHARFLDHDTGYGHPERPERLEAIQRGIDAADLREALVPVEPVPAADEILDLVHPAVYRRAIETFAVTGGGYLDGDTHVGPASWEAAKLAAGAGLEVIRRLDAGEGEVGFCAVRPPGHHATSDRAMGFCLLNNVAVAAAALAARGERVAIVDYDAHHGNGTQDIFWRDPNVFYVSLHEWPLYPGTGRIDDVGEGPGLGTTLNLTMPSGSTGDACVRAFEEVVVPTLAAWGPTWLLVSAGFDGHRADPLTGLSLSAGDFADLTRVILPLVPPGRRLLHLEGGYDLQALSDSVGAVLSAIVDGGRFRPESATSGGRGVDVVERALTVRELLRDGRLGGDRTG